MTTKHRVLLTSPYEKTTIPRPISSSSTKPDYNTVVHVLLTIECTALDSPDYRGRVVRDLSRTSS